jgi:cardiolipin synthase
MIADMESANQHIHLQSFIFMDDNIGTRIRELLIKKAAEGVEVRVIYDSVGSLKTKRRFFNEMSQAGIEVLEFSPVRIFRPTYKINYRNHRKILVIDGRVGYIGGINIADRYYDGGIYEEWRDTQIRVEGEAVFPMQSSFLLDRYFTINRHLTRRRKYYADIDIENIYRHKAATDIYSQFLTSGPDSDWSSIKGSYFSMITGASRRICINTPYFTPTESLMKAIRTASLGGVEVNLMMPARTDSTIIHYCSMSYIKELLRAGVNVYLFEKGFIHSKSISVDGEICMVGSANMDNRSMLHDFEVMSLIYNPQCAAILEEQFDKDISRCEKLSLQKWEKRGYKEKLYEGLARLVSPML